MCDNKMLVVGVNDMMSAIFEMINLREPGLIDDRDLQRDASVRCSGSHSASDRCPCEVIATVSPINNFESQLR